VSFRFPTASPRLAEALIFDSGCSLAAAAVPVFVIHGTPLDSGFTANTRTVELYSELRRTCWNL
jgi:hypothetical protein